jgi:hypothetical protein
VAAMIPARIQDKIGPQPHCENCGEICGKEIYRFQYLVAGQPEHSLDFCSPECWQHYFEVLSEKEVDRRFRKEANFLYRQICPACKRRFRKLTAKGELEEDE